MLRRREADPEVADLAAAHSLAGCRRKRFLTKDVLYRKGDRVDSVYVIRGGMVKLLSYMPNGRARIVRLHAKGHWIALEGLAGYPYEHTAVAIGEVDALVVPMSRMRLIEQDDPWQFSRILRNCCEHLSQADLWIADFSTGGIRPRVARLVEFLSKLEFGESSDLIELLTVQEMADMLGVTPESVSRTLAAFKRDNTLHRLGDCANELYRIDGSRLRAVARL